jgi:hypothetical protein
VKAEVKDQGFEAQNLVVVERAWAPAQSRMRGVSWARSPAMEVRSSEEWVVKQARKWRGLGGEDEWV